ncbi:MAG TPA: SatD family protein [Ornithinibacter sp.]|nr:SatD family protein [Ornithinibacter sp.]
MSTMKSPASRCVVIGDLVGSRGAPNRRALHRAVEKALVGVNAAVPAVTELRVTVGDEFQGAYSTLGAALEAALRVRLELLPGADVRVGIGRGPVQLLDAERGIEDGPGWWAARAAIEAVEQAAGRSATRHLRTAYRPAPGDDDAHRDGGRHADPDAVNAALLCRDHLVGSLSQRSLRLLRGLMDPHTTQSELAAFEGISASAVSQRVRTDGIGAVLAAQDLLRGLA